MKEIKDILKAYQRAEKGNIRTALATVVRVEGSSYRRPGARMLITEDGNLTGAISGGCLEGDALKKALSAIIQQQNKLVAYDSTDEDDARFGVQLGCNGIVYILFEPIFAADKHNPIALLTAMQSERKPAVLATLFSMEKQFHPGTAFFYRTGDCITKLPPDISKSLTRDAERASMENVDNFVSYTLEDQPVNGFLEYINPPISLVIAGAGNDAQPLAQMAYLIGWEVTVVDGRPAHATSRRFEHADRVLVVGPEEVLNQVSMDKHTAFVLMTHNYNYDLGLLKQLLATKASYIGSLGPKKKLLRMLDELGVNTSENQERVFGPVGLDIGAETAEEIALSILAEIKSVFSGASPRFLKDKKEPIHYQNIKTN